MTSFDGNVKNLQKNPTHFVLAHHFIDTFLKILHLQKVGHGQVVQFHNSMANVKISKCYFFHFFFSLRYCTDRTETDKPISLGKILQICLKTRFPINPINKYKEMFRYMSINSFTTKDMTNTG